MDSLELFFINTLVEEWKMEQSHHLITTKSLGRSNDMEDGQTELINQTGSEEALSHGVQLPPLE